MNLFQYSAVVSGAYGGGGEYVTQIGFGWTNGVILSLLKRFGHRLSSADKQMTVCAGPL